MSPTSPLRHRLVAQQADVGEEPQLHERGHAVREQRRDRRKRRCAQQARTGQAEVRQAIRQAYKGSLA